MVICNRLFCLLRAVNVIFSLPWGIILPIKERREPLYGYKMSANELF